MSDSCVFLLLLPSKLFCRVLVYFCCCYPPNDSVGFWCVSVAVTLQIILSGSGVFLLLLPSKSFCRVLVCFCCCGPPNHSVGFWRISVAAVAAALQIILEVLVYFCCCGPANYTGGSCVFPFAVALQIILWGACIFLLLQQIIELVQCI